MLDAKIRIPFIFRKYFMLKKTATLTGNSPKRKKYKVTL